MIRNKAVHLRCLLFDPERDNLWLPRILHRLPLPRPLGRGLRFGPRYARTVYRQMRPQRSTVRKRLSRSVRDIRCAPNLAGFRLS